LWTRSATQVTHAGRQGITVMMKSASDEQRRLLTAVGTLAPLVERGHVFATFPEAVTHAATHVGAASHPALARTNPARGLH
jgi:SulP family sulfate permease